MINHYIGVKLMLMGIAFLIIADVLMIETPLSKAAVIFGLFFSVYGLFYSGTDEPKKKNDLKKERNLNHSQENGHGREEQASD